MRTLTTGAVTAVLLALPGAAAAQDYYVDGSVNASGTCLTPATACKTIQEGVDKAKSAGPDTVHVAAGTYTESVVMGYNAYDGTTLEGAGVSGTTIVPPTGTAAALTLGGGTPNASALTVKGLRVQVPASLTGAGSKIASAGESVLVEDVVVESEQADNYGGLIGVTGGSATLRRVTATQPADDPSTPSDQPGPAVSYSITAPGSASLTVEDSELIGAGVAPGPALDAAAIGTGVTATLTVRRTKLLTRAAASYGLRVQDMDTSVESSLVAQAGGGILFTAYRGARSLALDHVTLAPSAFYSLFVNSADAYDATVQLDNSIVTRDFHLQEMGAGNASVACAWSDVPNPPSAATSGVDCPIGTAAGNTSSTPAALFADAGYHPKGGGPTIDSADPAYTAGAGGDLAGNARIVDGDGAGGAASDKGAYEYQRQAPSATAGAAPTTAQAGSPISFTATATDGDPGDTFSYAWDFGDGSAPAAGAAPQHAYASAGSYTTTVTVTDSGGRTDTATVEVTVTSPPSSGGQGGTPESTGQQQSQDTGTPQVDGGHSVIPDSSAPVLSRVKLQRKRFRVGRASTARVARRASTGTAFGFALSEPATVKITIQQKTKRGRRTKWRRRGTLTRSLAAGAQSVRFSGRIGRRALKPGSYRAVVVATDAAGNASRAKRIRFTIVRG